MKVLYSGMPFERNLTSQSGCTATAFIGSAMASMLIALILITITSTSASARSEADRRIAPLATPVELGTDNGAYVHFGTLSRLPSGRLVYAGYQGTGHKGESGGSDIVVSVSDDQGGSWTPFQTVADGLKTGKRNRAPRLGYVGDGRIILIYLDGPELGSDGPWRLVQRFSDDGLAWTSPRPLPITNQNPSNPFGSQLIVYGPIERDNNGRLAAMAYLGHRNYRLVSDDNAESWRLETLFDERTVPELDADANEAAFETLPDGREIGVVRLGGRRNAMMQFSGGQDSQWSPLGPLPLPISGGYVSPDMVTVSFEGEQYLVLLIMHRASKNAKTRRPNDASILLLCSPVDRDPPLFRSAGVLDLPNSLKWRSGYPSALQDGNKLLMTYHSEESPDRSNAWFAKFDLVSLLTDSGQPVCR